MKKLTYLVLVMLVFLSATACSLTGEDSIEPLIQTNTEGGNGGPGGAPDIDQLPPN